MYKNKEKIDTYHRCPKFLNRDFIATKLNQKWVTVVTYIRTLQDWTYLSTIKDLYDDFIVAPVFDHTNSIALVTHALKRATQKIKSLMGLSSTVTRGCKTFYRHIMSLSVIDNITPSMLRRGNCWDNSLMENIFGYLKEEY